MLFHIREEFIIFYFNYTYLSTGWDVISFCHCNFIKINSQSNNAQSEILGSIKSTDSYFYQTNTALYPVKSENSPATGDYYASRRLIRCIIYHYADYQIVNPVRPIILMYPLWNFVGGRKTKALFNSHHLTHFRASFDINSK